MALKGKCVTINASSDGSIFNRVAELNDGTMSIDGDNIDITSFGDCTNSLIDRIQGLVDSSYSLSGFYDPTDTTGQVLIRNALLNDTQVYVQFLADGTNGFQQEVKVATFEISATVDGVVNISIDLEGTGAITSIP